ncbi:MAG: hypothetical protein ABIP27_01490 [Flavobacterium circumlabens]|nr:hypothetical protein [Flavobacterium circumlabens]TCN58757.1 hypothetical protein EV142_103197 [Flavobacterium circumlabens]
METAFFLIMGWCGTGYPGWLRDLLKKWPPPPPDPEPWRHISIIVLGLVAGLVGGHFFSNAIAENQFFAGQRTIAAGLFAFGASNVATVIALSLKR